MKIGDFPTPAWVALVVASIRVLLDWRRGVPFLVNVQRVVALYVISGFVAWLACAVVGQPGVDLTGRDTAICAIITFFGINIVYSLKQLGEDLEHNPLRFVSIIVSIWARAGRMPEDMLDEEYRDGRREEGEHKEGNSPKATKPKAKINGNHK